MKRRRRRNPKGGVIQWAREHPWLTVLFVLPTIAYLPVAIIRAINPPPPLKDGERERLDTFGPANPQ